MTTPTPKNAYSRLAKRTADYLKNGVTRRNGWARVCMIYKGSHACPNESGIDRLTKALCIHYDGTTFSSRDIGQHYEITCSDVRIAAKASQFVEGWLSK